MDGREEEVSGEGSKMDGEEEGSERGVRWKEREGEVST